jgi:hypothetical protein
MSHKLIITSKARSIIQLYTAGVSKKSIGKRPGLLRKSVKKYIGSFLASGKTPEEIDNLSDTELGQMFLYMVPRNHIEDDQRYISLGEFFPTMEKALKSRGNTKYMLWKVYAVQHPYGYRFSPFNHHHFSRTCNRMAICDW